MGTIADHASLRHGYTMGDLDRIAKAASRRAGWALASDQADIYEAAWHGIVERVYANDEDDERELLFAGIRAIQRLSSERNQAHGRSSRHGYEFGSAPRFATYWNERVVTPSHEESCVEKAALWQVLGTISADQYDALAAASVHDSLSSAAGALGITYAQFIRRFYAARDAVRAAWFEGETPRAEAATDDSCKSGHRRDVHTRTKADGKRYCQECQRLAKARRRARIA